MEDLTLENETGLNQGRTYEGDFDEDASRDAFSGAEKEQLNSGGTLYNNALEAYLGTALKYKLLTKAQEIEYATKAQMGDKDAFDAMMLANLRLVVKVARKYTQSKLPVEDLISEGNMGLMIAISKFDPEMGFRFSTYAHHWIRQSVSKAIGNQARTVRWPMHVVAKGYQLRKLIEKWTMEGVDFTEKELAEALGVSTEKLYTLRNLYSFESSLNAPSMSDDDDRTMQDSLFDTRDDMNESHRVKEQDNQQLSVIMSQTLTKREEGVLSMRFGMRVDPMTLEEVASHHDLTRERIRQIESVAIKKLKRRFLINGLQMSDFIERDTFQ
jgi:RNA polymerase sigma factor (sigma-70 family)